MSPAFDTGWCCIALYIVYYSALSLHFTFWILISDSPMFRQQEDGQIGRSLFLTISSALFTATCLPRRALSAAKAGEREGVDGADRKSESN